MGYIKQIDKLIGDDYNNANDGAFIALARGGKEIVNSEYLVMGNASTVFTSVCNELASCIVRWADGDIEKMRAGLREIRTELGKMCYEKWEEEHRKPDFTAELKGVTEELKKVLLGDE